MPRHIIKLPKTKNKETREKKTHDLYTIRIQKTTAFSSEDDKMAHFQVLKELSTKNSTSNNKKLSRKKNKFKTFSDEIKLRNS